MSNENTPVDINYSCNVRITSIEDFVKDLKNAAIQIKSMITELGIPVQPPLTIKEQLEEGKPVNARDVFNNASTPVEKSADDNPDKTEEGARDWRTMFEELAAPCGSYSAISAYKEANPDCPLCTHDIHGFLEAWVQNQAASFATWLTDMPKEKDAALKYLAAKCWK